MKKIGIEIPVYNSENDPTRDPDTSSIIMDWTVPTSRIKEMKVLYKKVCKPTKRKRKTFMYERDREDDNDNNVLNKKNKTRKQSIPIKIENNYQNIVGDKIDDDVVGSETSKIINIDNVKNEILKIEDENSND